MATVLAFRRNFNDCECEYRPSPTSKDAEVVELAFSSLDHKLAPWARQFVTELVPLPTEREFQKVSGIASGEEFREQIRTARRKREDFEVVVKRLLETVRRHSGGSKEECNTWTRMEHFREVRNRTLCQSELKWDITAEALYTEEVWHNLRENTVKEVFSVFRERYGRWPTAAESNALQSFAHQATRLVAALLPLEEAILLPNV